jgi:raffinose/stachyose/melibiose transport system substrate-binding protein
MSTRTGTRRVFAIPLLVGAVLACAVTAGATTQKKSDQITVTMETLVNQKAIWDVMIPNFERVYPNITINISYNPNNTIQYQNVDTQLAAGNAPDIIPVAPGYGTPIAVHNFAKAGYLAPMVNKPWLKRLVPSVLARDKYGKVLYASTNGVGFYGVFINNTLFKQKGYDVPQTFLQLLSLCKKAHAAGVNTWLLGASDQSAPLVITMDIAIATVYAKDPNWEKEREAGKVTFNGTPGWHQAFQRFQEMNSAGCFQAGAAGTTNNSALQMFALGQGLMWFGITGQKAAIDASNPQFTYTFGPAPVADSTNVARDFYNPDVSFGVNAHAPQAEQQAAQQFIDFVARPKQQSLAMHILGDITQYEWLHSQLPDWMAPFKQALPLTTQPPPLITWWNADVGTVLRTNGVGLITGQQTVSGILQAMDKAFDEGPQ